MNRLDPDIAEYIRNSFASYHIEFYINEGFEPDRAIRRGWEEAYEELLEELHFCTSGGGDSRCSDRAVGGQVAPTERCG